MKWHQMTWNDTKWHQMIWDDTKWHEMTWNDMKWHEMTWNDMKCHEMAWNDMKWHDITSNYYFDLRRSLDVELILSLSLSCRLFRQTCFLTFFSCFFGLERFWISVILHFEFSFFQLFFFRLDFLHDLFLYIFAKILSWMFLKFKPFNVLSQIWFLFISWWKLWRSWPFTKVFWKYQLYTALNCFYRIFVKGSVREKWKGV